MLPQNVLRDCWADFKQTIVSFSVLTGPPIAGVLITRDNGRYLYAQVFAAASMVVGFLLLLGARIAATGNVVLCKA